MPDNYTLLVSTPAISGAELTATAIRCHEAINAVNSVELDASCPTVFSAELIASHVTLSFKNDANTRLLDNLVAEFHRLPGDATADHYHLTLRPWLWWLTLGSNNRIFQNLSTPDIVKQVFAGFTDYKLQLNATYPPREYCVQYGETDFAFVCRLLEEEGIFYFFTHADGVHTLVLADNNDVLPACPVQATLPYLGQKLGGRELHGIRAGGITRQAVAGGYKTTDYEFTTPAASLYSQAQADAQGTSVYEHPGGYNAKSRGDALGTLRTQALRSLQQRFMGESDCRWLIPGHTFTLTGHDDAAANIEWLVIAVTHDASQQQYKNRFEAIPKSVPYRPPRSTPRPRMHTQTARVVGKAGEEIWTDQYGRIKVQFNWDREGVNDEKSSCWIRVAQGWTGKGFGAYFIPRIGQEVVVTFIDGDPDRPLVTACVYNGDNVHPYALPTHQTRSGLMTQSSKGAAGFHELRFDDKKGEEEIFLQSQKDMNVNILNDVSHTVGHDETRTIKNARTHTVQEADDSLTVAKGNRSVTVATGNETIDIKANRTLKAGGDETRSVGGNLKQTITGNYTLTVDGNLSIKVNGTLSIEGVGGVEIKSDAAASLQAGTSLTHKAGTSLLNQAGTSLDNKAGTTLTNDAGVSLTNKAGASQTVDGGGMLTLKGGIIKAN